MEASIDYSNMGDEEGDFWTWTLRVSWPPGRGGVPRFPIKPGVTGYEIVEASDEEREHLKAGHYLDGDGQLKRPPKPAGNDRP